MKLPLIHLPCSVTALKYVISRSDYHGLLKDTEDIRHIFQQAADCIGVEELSLVEAIGKILKVQFNEGKHLFRNKGGLLFSDLLAFRKVGALPFIRDGVAQGAVCVNPRWVGELIPRRYWGNVTLGLWSDIACGLCAMEEGVEETESTPEIMALSLVICEAVEFGANKISVQRADGATQYTFRTSDRKNAQGEVSSNIAETFLSVLNQFSGQPLGIPLAGHKIEVVEHGPNAYEINIAGDE